MKHLTIVAGTRPNFVKVAAIIKELQKTNKLTFSLVHTGQHYDENMSNSFFTDLDIPEPTINLKVGAEKGLSELAMFAKIMISFEAYLVKNKTDLVVVVGDVTSTAACAIVAQKLKIKVAHVEAGIRSGDWTMPEEINRLLTDAITNYYFTTSTYANENLKKSGVDGEVYYVGNTMIDTLVANRSRFRKPDVWAKCNLEKGNYIVLTLHRPSNVDSLETLNKLLLEVLNNTRDCLVVFPVHPRTKKTMQDLGHFDDRLKLIDPLPYLEFMCLVENCKAVITDSGGITEETTFLNIPCITIRDSTERPETVTVGSNELIGTDLKNIKKYLDKLFNFKWKASEVPPLWDGNTSKRLVDIIQTKILNTYEE